MTYTTTFKNSYPNANLNMGPVQHTKKDAVGISEKSDANRINEYSAHLPAMITYLKFDNPSARRLKGATIGPNEKTDFHISQLGDIRGNIVVIAYFVNGLLLNINKLPYGPLVFDGDTVNNLPLKNFVILPSDDISEWDNIEPKESKLWAAFLEHRVKPLRTTLPLFVLKNLG